MADADYAGLTEPPVFSNIEHFTIELNGHEVLAVCRVKAASFLFTLAVCAEKKEGAPS